MKKVKIGNRFIGEGELCLIIAEISGNHLQKYELAERTVRAACEAGADAIKLQTYTADTMTLNCNKEPFQIQVNDAWKGQTLYSLYQKGNTPWEWHEPLSKIAENHGVILFSSPFDNTAVDFLEKQNVPAYKIASFEVVDIPLLEKVASTRKPVIMSTGMASLEEIKLAYKTLKENGTPEVVLLKCVSSYPAVAEEMNLSTIPDLRKKFNTLVGLSDHTITTEVPVAAVTLEAKVIEKHFILSRKIGGPDAAFSLEPQEFEEMIRQIRSVEKAIGIPHYGVGKKELENLQFRKSLLVARDIQAGEILTTDNIRSVRPGHGLSPKYYKEILGKKAIRFLEFGTGIKLEDIE
jgi:pseudaminic acid synthase